MWVAVGQQGPGNVSMVYSNDGIVWNAITNPIHNMFSVAWKPNGLWVASSDTTVVSPYYYSDDGITWTASSTSIVSAPPGNFLGGGISTPFIPANKCICNKNGFCTGINKLPCETKNTKCFAIYKRSNSNFNRQGAVSGGSRINRLKYQTRMKAQGRTVNGRNNVINGRRPATLYRTSRPLTLRDNTCINPPPPPSNLFAEESHLIGNAMFISWKNPDISKLCRIAPIIGFTIQRTGSPFGHTVNIGLTNQYDYLNVPQGIYDIRIKTNSYYGSSDWVYLNNIGVFNPAKINDLKGQHGNSSVTLTWTKPHDGGFPITNYEYSVNNGSFILTNSTNTSVTVPSLTNGISYTFKVRAINGNPTVDSNIISVTPSTIPGAPTGFAGSGGLRQAILSWTAPSNDGGSSITEYKYNINSGPYISTGSTATNVTVTGLANGTGYSFTVKAVNVNGDGNLAEGIVNLTTFGVPRAPYNLHTYNPFVTPTSFLLLWTEPPWDGGLPITDYKIKINSDPWVSIGVPDPLNHTITGLTSGTSYTVKLLAVNSLGDGAESSPLSVLTLMPPPYDLSGVPRPGVSNQSTLTWKEPTTIATSYPSGENITYDIFLLNQDPGSPPSSSYALNSDQVGPYGVPGQSRSYNTGTCCTPNSNPIAGSTPEGVYYFMIRTRKNSNTGELIIASDYVASGPINATP